MAGMRAVHKKNGTTFKYSGDLKETIEKAEKELKEKDGTTQWLFLKWQYDNARKAFEKYNRRLEDLKDFIKLAKVTLNLRGGVKASISQNSKGEINVERTETKKQKLTE